MSMWTRMQTWFSRPGPDSRGTAHLVRFVVPNGLSLLRIGLALAFPWVPTTQRGGVVIAAGLSDLFDGRLSRALQGSSTFGQILDPLADKLFVGIVLITLVLDRVLSPVELLLLGFRDLVVLAGSIWSVVRHGWKSLRHMPPSLLGKLATAGQLGFLVLLTLGRDRDHTTSLFRLIEVAAMVISVLAGLDYLGRKRSLINDHETTQL